MAERRLGVALIGQGFMGKAHSNAYRQVKHFFDVPFSLDLRVICGRNQDALAAMAARWGWAETATDWRAVVERPDIDIVDVAVPNHLHAEVAIAAARAGKIVFCEKPLAANTEDSARMVEAARGRPTLVWFNYRRLPAVQLTRRLVEEGRIGTPFHYRAWYLQEWGNDPSRPPGWKTSREHAGSGVLGDLLSHSIDLALLLNGPIAEVTGAMQHTFAAGRDVDDATLALVRFANGSVGSFEATRYATGFRNRNAFELHGARGAVRFSLEDLNRLEYFDATQPRELASFANLLVSNPFWKPGHISGYEHTFIATLAEFLIALGRGDAFHPDFADAHAVQLVLDAISRKSQA